MAIDPSTPTNNPFKMIWNRISGDNTGFLRDPTAVADDNALSAARRSTQNKQNLAILQDRVRRGLPMHQGPMEAFSELGSDMYGGAKILADQANGFFGGMSNPMRGFMDPVDLNSTNLNPTVSLNSVYRMPDLQQMPPNPRVNQGVPSETEQSRLFEQLLAERAVPALANAASASTQPDMPLASPSVDVNTYRSPGTQRTPMAIGYGSGTPTMRDPRVDSARQLAFAKAQARRGNTGAVEANTVAPAAAQVTPLPASPIVEETNVLSMPDADVATMRTPPKLDINQADMEQMKNATSVDANGKLQINAEVPASPRNKGVSAKMKAPVSDKFSDIIQFGENSLPDAVSEKGAKSSMQVISKTAKDPGFGVTPAKNDSLEELERVGREYADKMLEVYKNPVHAAVAYNWGPGNTNKWLASGGDMNKLPKETRNYIKRISPYIKDPSVASNDLLKTYRNKG